MKSKSDQTKKYKTKKYKLLIIPAAFFLIWFFSGNKTYRYLNRLWEDCISQSENEVVQSMHIENGGIKTEGGRILSYEDKNGTFRFELRIYPHAAPCRDDTAETILRSSEDGSYVSYIEKDGSTREEPAEENYSAKLFLADIWTPLTSQNVEKLAVREMAEETVYTVTFSNAYYQKINNSSPYIISQLRKKETEIHVKDGKIWKVRVYTEQELKDGTLLLQETQSSFANPSYPFG